MNVSIAKQFGCNIKANCPLQVTVASGKTLLGDTMCSDFIWKLQGEIFNASVMLLPLGCCDMVLGIQWLSTLRDIKCNFQELRMSFAYNGKVVNLRGSTKPAVQWMTGKQMPKETEKATYLAMCVYPNAMLNMISDSTTAHHYPLAMKSKHPFSSYKKNLLMCLKF